MKILFLTQYFPPEVGAPQNRIFEFAKRLKLFGHDITILTAMPNYPKGEIFEEYKGKKFLIEEIDGIKVIRTSIYASKDKSFIKRLKNYLSFTFSSLFKGTKYVGSQDAVIVESPPLFLGWSGYHLAKRKKAKFIFNISDLWPESAVKLDVLHNKLLIRMSTKLEEFLYKKADAVTGQTKGIVNNIVSRGFDKNKIHLITNGVDVDFFKKSNRDDQIRKNFGVENKFVVCYAGTLGLAQGLETVLDAAYILNSSACKDNIQFLIIGDGAEKQRLLKIKEDKKLDNVTFVGLQPKKNMPKIIASMDSTIIPLKKLDIFKGALPSKMFECMASELPIILSVEGEAADLINDAKAGIVVEPEMPEQIANAILKMYKDPEIAKEFGSNGRKYIAEYFSRDIITRRLENIIINLNKKNN